MDIVRIARHLVTTHWRVRRAFPHATLHAIERMIKTGEAAHRGQIRFVVEGALDPAPLLAGQSARERAIDVFSHLRMWDTEHNNGVLIYLLLADRDVEIVADRGVHRKVDAAEWEHICRTMEAAFGRRDYEAGAVAGVEAVTRLLTTHFPAVGDGVNELPDRPVVL